MQLNKNRVLSTIAVALSFAAGASAQTYGNSYSYSKGFGNSDAGAQITAYAGWSASRRSETISTPVGRFSILSRRDTLRASAYGLAVADLKLLGERKRAGYFYGSLSANATIDRTWQGAVTGTSCSSSGFVYAKVGNNVIWNQSFKTVAVANINYRLKIMTPTIVLPVGIGIVGVNGRGYGRLNSATLAIIDPCNAEVRLNGATSVDGDGYGSAWVISVATAASFSGSFRMNEQTLNFGALRAKAGQNRTGWATLELGSMSANLRVRAWFLLPPFYINHLITSWSKGRQSLWIL